MRSAIALSRRTFKGFSSISRLRLAPPVTLPRWICYAAAGASCCLAVGQVSAVESSSPGCKNEMLTKTKPLAGKKALVFGGTSGIGLAAAVQLREEGAHVVAISRDISKARAEVSSSFELASCDVLDRDALAKLFAAEAPFDILISAATGGERALGPFLEMDMAGYQGSFAKLWGYANVVRFGAQYLPDNGCIVLVSGTPARKARPGQVALASVGAAVEQFARTIAPELAPRRINVVSPGVIATPMFGPDSEERRGKLGNATAKNIIPRPGTPEEAAKGILFAVQNEFVTGTTIDVDGGWLHSL